MPVWIALLRGINVSGQKSVSMERLRGLFEGLGFPHTRTYVQSGNVVFDAPAGPESALERKIGKGIHGEFGFPVAVLLRTAREMAEVVRNNAFAKGKGADLSRLYVTFLAEKPGKAAVKNLEALAAATTDRFMLHGREIFLHCPDGYGRTRLSNAVFEKKLSATATTRNWRTVTTLCDLAAAG